ncbi:MAG TPA: S9 family peptidase [Streptosporangiaceae bacterium]|nr:S9 family peptidase [Streptosporangiaceae bacterium]
MGFDLNRLLDIRLYLAFDADEAGRVLAGSDDTGSTQIIEIAPDETVTPLTALPGACTGRYIPGQRTVIVSHDDGGNERHQLSLLHLDSRLGPAQQTDLVPLVRDPRYIHTLADVTPSQICYFTNRRNGIAFDPVIRDLATGAERHMVFGDRSYEEAAISPDGRWLALTVHSKVTANASHVALADLTAPDETLVPVTEVDAPALTHSLSWAPGGDALIFTSNHDREFLAVARYDLATRELTWLVTDDRADLTGQLSADGTRLLVERNDDGASKLSVHDAATGELLRDLPLPAVGTITGIRIPRPRWTPDSRKIVASISAPILPGDVLLVDPGDGTTSALTGRDVTGYHPVLPELHRVPAPDGALIPCRVYRGRAYQGSAPEASSTVLVIHGGPESQARQTYDPVVQGLAAAGHTVLVPNVRGSTGYGKKWYQADDRRNRFASVEDLAAVHAYLPELGLDQGRAALWGGSYGGYMVLAGLAFQPHLWAAGVDIVGIASFVTFLENTSPYRRAYREREYGTLAEDREFLDSISPLTRVGDIVAPLFIIHGANDPRVPLSEAEQIYKALTGLGRECELLVYPDEGHGLSKRGNRADALPKAFAFLERHLRYD